WLGYRVKGEGRSLSVEPRDEADSPRRRAFLSARGVALADLVRSLAAGESVPVATADASTSLPFGLPAWREILAAPELSASNAFLVLAHDAAASRILVAFAERERGAEAGRLRKLHAALQRSAPSPRPSEPYDFEHLAPRMAFTADGELDVPGGSA